MLEAVSSYFQKIGLSISDSITDFDFELPMMNNLTLFEKTLVKNSTIVSSD